MTAADELIVGRYRLVRRLAGGGMGTVWEGWDERLHRQVAIKQLHAQPGLSQAAVALANDRALREARITARLHHPYAITVYDVVEHQGQPCLIMEYLNSTSLQAIIATRGSLPPREVARIGAQVAAALVTAHRAGIVHRDVKPGNVLIAEDGTAKLTDFGISHAVGDLSLTSTGMVTGTPAFLAPEVARGRESDFASDVFSLGSTLYDAVEGMPAFGPEENPMAMLHKVASGQVIAPRQAGELTPLLTRMLAVDPTRRPAMPDVATALESVHRLGVLPPALRDVPTETVPVAAAGAPPGDELTSTIAMPAVTAPRAGTVPSTAGIRPTAPGRASGRGALSTPVAAALIVAALLLVGGITAGVLLLSNSGGSTGTPAPSHSASLSPTVSGSVSNSASGGQSSRAPQDSSPQDSSSPPTSAPNTPAPSTTAPSTTAPSSSIPNSSAPSTTTPSTSGSSSTAPISTANSTGASGPSLTPPITTALSPPSAPSAPSAPAP